METITGELITETSKNVFQRALSTSAEFVKKHPVATAAVATGVIGGSIYLGYRRYRKMNTVVVPQLSAIDQLRADVAARRAGLEVAEAELTLAEGLPTAAQ